MKLLIVEDEVQIREGLSREVAWDSIGIHQVFSTSNGLEGYKMFSQEECDIVITDIRMPIMDGLELARRIKTVSPSTEIIIISGFSDFSYAQKAIRFGVLEYELKPLKIGKLLDIVSRAVKKKTNQTLKERKTSENRQHSPQVGQIVDYIYENYSQTISVRNIAELFQLTPNYVSHIFRSELGTTLIEFIHRIRVQHATELLKRKDLLIYQIAEMVGYANEFYFMKVFKRITGVSPNTYRKDT